MSKKTSSSISSADFKVGVLSSQIRRSVTITAKFSAAHFYKQNLWSDQKNEDLFGRCFTPYGHGHNYRLEVDLALTNKVPVDWIQRMTAQLHKVTGPLDHEHLNFVIPYFKDHIPTTENILIYLATEIKKTELANFLLRLRLFEMEDLWTQMDLTK